MGTRLYLDGLIPRSRNILEQHENESTIYLETVPTLHLSNYKYGVYNIPHVQWDRPCIYLACL